MHNARILSRIPALLCALSTLGWLSGCVGFHAKPLDAAESMPDAASRIYVDATALPLPELRQHRFDPADGLDETEVAMLAVVNNPDLRLLRDDLGIQQAQAFAAGLLPDPQISFAQDFPIHPAPDLVNAVAAGLTYDISALLLRPSTAKASRLATRKLELDELWAEWQTIAQSRVLFHQVRADESLLSELKSLLPDREGLQRSVQAAVRSGNVSADAAAGALIAVADLNRQIGDAAQRLNQEQHSLRLLLGLSEHSALPLVDDASASDESDVTVADIDQRLATLPLRRPDLLALRAGYDAQEEKLRQAVLKQFPAISVGFNYAVDTSNIATRGYSVSLTLPLFDRGRGAIAVETATRQRLFDEYQSRLAATRSDIDRIRNDLPNIERQQQQAEQDARQLRQDQAAASRAFGAGLLDWNAYLTITTAALTRRIESVQLAVTLDEQRGALQTLLGHELPKSSFGKESSR